MVGHEMRTLSIPKVASHVPAAPTSSLVGPLRGSQFDVRAFSDYFVASLRSVDLGEVATTPTATKPLLNS